ncbi:plant expansin [Coniophora puteana RWD-64-598 SS2]|uniref:Plant expansin n=1 Tax=Coniophora puteana (strain RWD-64-598) TaxID=741705 RepID=R7SEK6_CONPW|nr:plant expansin [Coniophora puteana RWD-64-598 SS2]EIW74608.1 plant expansin [Coniophora puteana RWD-64-598 SS2]
MYAPVFLIALLSALFVSLVASAPISSSTNETSSGLTKRFDNQRMTWYKDGQDACGWSNTPDQYIVAISESLFGSGENCGKAITIQYGGASATATVADRCEICPEYGLDLSEGLFSFFAPEHQGVIQAKWWFN